MDFQHDFQPGSCQEGGLESTLSTASPMITINGHTSWEPTLSIHGFNFKLLPAKNCELLFSLPYPCEHLKLELFGGGWFSPLQTHEKDQASRLFVSAVPHSSCKAWCCSHRAGDEKTGRGADFFITVSFEEHGLDRNFTTVTGKMCSRFFGVKFKTL